jgi:hypothetical protein
MNIDAPLLACSSGHISGWGLVIAYYLVIGIAGGALLAAVNILLIAASESQRGFKLRNLGLLACYVLPGVSFVFAMYAEDLGVVLPSVGGFEIFAIIPYLFAVPIVVISHFVYLLFKRKKLKALAAEALSSESAGAVQG